MREVLSFVLMLLVFNGILALAGTAQYVFQSSAQVRMTAEVQYSSFLDLYLFVAVLEFMMLIFIMPAITSGSISGEREPHTLELMLTTKMKPSEIVLGKLASALSTVFLMIVSSFPIVSLVFVYGGVTLKDVGLLMICYLASVLFVGSLGISCSAIFGRSTLAICRFSYGITGSECRRNLWDQ
ncbi:MAG: ABC transporter permease [Lachnospiraceae bacterium]